MLFRSVPDKFQPGVCRQPAGTALDPRAHGSFVGLKRQLALRECAGRSPQQQQQEPAKEMAGKCKPGQKTPGQSKPGQSWCASIDDVLAAAGLAMVKRFRPASWPMGV